MSISIEKWQQYITNPVLFLEEQYITKEGTPIKLTDWQVDDVITPIFDTVDTEGYRMYDTAVIGLPRKMGKSSLAAGITLYFLVCGGMGSEIYGAAVDRQQAGIIFNMARQAVKRSESDKNDSILSEIITTTKNELVCEKTESIYKVLSSDAAGSWGFNPICLIIDEFHAWEAPSSRAEHKKSRCEEYYDALSTSFGAQKEPLTFVITTAGHPVRSRMLHKMYQDALTGKDARVYMHWASGEASVRDMVSKCPHIRQDYIDYWDEKCGSDRIKYRRFFMNEWVQDDDDALSIEAVAQCRDKHVFYHQTYNPKYIYNIGFDLGVKRARACGVVTHKDNDSGLIIVDNKEVWDVKADKVAAGGKVISKNDVKQVNIQSCINWIVSMAQKFNIVRGNGRILVDPYELRDFVQSAPQKYGMIVEPYEMYGSNVSKLSRSLESMVVGAILRFPFNDVMLSDELLTLQGRTTATGWRLDKAGRGYYSDQAIALGLSAMCSAENSDKIVLPVSAQTELLTTLVATTRG
jgi:phage terminase large subunit-like protein